MRLYLIADRSALDGSLDSLPRFFADAAHAGIDVAQIREKDISARALYELAGATARLVEDSPLRLLVNDRLDIALATGASGVHLTTTSMPTADIRAAVSDTFDIARSTHSSDEIREASAGGANLAVFGPIYDTPSKRGLGEPCGIDGLRRAVETSPIPIYALGGICESHVEAIAASGAEGIAGIRIFSDAWRAAGARGLALLVKRLKGESS